MQSTETAIFFRDDTFLGVCEALGEDFGFNPIYLRLAFSVLLIWNPVVVIGAYMAAGLVIGFSRLIVPNPRRPQAEANDASGAGQELELSDELAVAA